MILLVRSFIVILILSSCLTGCGLIKECFNTPNADIEIVNVISDPSLGAVQGVVVRDGFVYAYGDKRSLWKHSGVIREYTTDLKYTGRMVKLTKNGIAIITHPTGLTWNKQWGTFIGNTVKRKGTIFRIDWPQAWKESNLDNAVLNIIDDDAASDGSRPAFVNVGEESFIASADYRVDNPELRLYNITAMLSAGRTASEGVISHKIKCGRYTQNLYWDSEKGYLTFVQNMSLFGGLHLETINLSKAITEGTTISPSVKISSFDFSERGELEGWYPLSGNVSLFAVNNKKQNLFSGMIKIKESYR